MNNNLDNKIITNKSAKSNFGKWGWFIIIFCLMAFWLSAGMQQEGLNVSLTQFNLKFGWDTGILLSYNSIGGYIGMLGTIVIGALASKKGVRYAFVFSLLCGGVGMIAWGFITDIFMYIVCCALVNFMANGFGFMCCTMIIARWFPTKKGLAMGWATIGCTLATACYALTFSKLMEAGGIGFGHSVMGILAVALGIVAILFLRNNPEEVGQAPDNDSNFDKKKFEEELKLAEEYKATSPWTLSKVLRTKQTWLIGAGIGIVMMCNGGMLMQFVPRCVELGLTENKAMVLLAIAALVGSVGSYIWGVLDQKLGTKQAGIAMAIVHTLGIVFNLISGYNMAIWALYVSTFFIACCIGASANFIGSLTASVYGRYDFDKAFTPTMTICVAFRTAAMLVVGLISARTGGFNEAYIFLAVAGLIAAFLISRIDMRCIGRMSFVEENEINGGKNK